MQARISELQSELDLVNARRNFHDTMTQFAYQSDANGAGVNALKAHIDAIAVSIPSSSGARSAGARGGSAPARSPRRRPRARRAREATHSGRLGIWDLAANVMRLSDKLRTIDAVDRRTAALQDTFTQIRTPPRRGSRRSRRAVTPSRSRRIRPTAPP